MHEPFGVGLVGAGGFGAFCLEAYSELPEVRVVAVADTDLERAQRVAPPRATVSSDYRALLADPAVQIVAINTPPFLHGPMARQAAEAGKHIFVEKPLATSLEEAVAAVEAARAAGVTLSVDYVLRHHQLHRLAAEVVKSRALGAFQHWSLENFATDDNLPPDHWFWDHSRSGGIHVEHGVHFFDLCTHLAGTAPDEVAGCAQQRPDGRVDRVSATVRYGRRVLATFYHSFNQIGRFERTTIRLNFARGHIVTEGWIPTDLTLWGVVDEAGLGRLEALFGDRLEVRERFHGAASTVQHGGVTEHLAAAVAAEARAPERQLEYKRAVQAGMRDLVAAIRDNRPPEVSAADGLLSLAVALAASDPETCGRPLPAIPDVAG
ncbi:MAG: Gfo/Idh/MocA family oxidoreductase [Ardenticatenaceae bacterium]|nr:Gfo/Idh/MocA family oxidoreductase [Ardenticatenaceae bacterium]